MTSKNLPATSSGLCCNALTNGGFERIEVVLGAGMRLECALRIEGRSGAVEKCGWILRDYQRDSPQQPEKRQHLPDGKRILQQAFQQNGSRRTEKGRSERAQPGNSGEPRAEISAQGANHQKQERRQA